MQTRIRLFGGLSLILLFSCPGCDTSSKPVADAVLAPAGELKANPNGKVPVVSEVEAQAFGDDWMRCVVTGNMAQANRLVGWKKILERSIESFSMDAKAKADYLQGANGLSTNLVQTIKANADKGCTYRLVRIAQRGGYPHAVFRLLDPNGALNYHDLRLVKAGGKVQADHFFVAASGEDLADSLRKVVAPTIKSTQSALSRLTGEAKRSIDALKQQQQMALAVRSGRLEEALSLYDSLPEDLKKQKMPMLNRVMATDVANEEEYLKVIDEYVAQFPDDASIGLLTLDAAILRNDLDLLEKSRRQINAWTGGDDYIDLLVGGVLATSGETERAEEITRDIDPSELLLAAAHEFKLTIAMIAKDHSEVLKQLRALRDEYALEYGDLTQAEGFEAFVESSQFAEWLGDPS